MSELLENHLLPVVFSLFTTLSKKRSKKVIWTGQTGFKDIASNTAVPLRRSHSRLNLAFYKIDRIIDEEVQWNPYLRDSTGLSISVP